MKAIAEANPDLAGALPQGYQGLPNSVLQELLRLLAPLKIEGDAYGLIFEYFMGQFAASFMQKGGEYFTPASIVKLIVEIIEPYHGAIFDPACGSGGMFVHSAEFVRRHHKSPSKEISIYGVEKMTDTLRLCRMNLAVHGLSGDIREANSYYDDPHKLIGRFDFVMANPPFNQSEVDRAKLVTDAGKVVARFPLGLPSVNNANYLWINLFYAALNPSGRAGFVMANSASDAGGSERELRKKLIETGAVDCIVAVGPNMFFTVTLPVTLWFLDKGKAKGPRADKVLFVDARHLFRQVTRANRTFDPDHIEFLGNIVRLWRDEKVETDAGSGPRIVEAFPDGKFRDGSNGSLWRSVYISGTAPKGRSHASQLCPDLNRRNQRLAYRRQSAWPFARGLLEGVGYCQPQRCRRSCAMPGAVYARWRQELQLHRQLRDGERQI